MHHKFDLTGVQTHDLQIIDSTFHVPDALALTTEPSGTSPGTYFYWVEVRGRRRLEGLVTTLQ